ncbi:MAG: Rrf2 family transcriptional regulator [bacterium]
MKVSSKAEYGILAMVDLALHSQTGPVKIRDIAERQSIPKKYLEQVLLDLKRGGLVGSSRGKNGGYTLSGNPDEITVYDILEHLEEQISFVEQGRDRPGFLQSFWDEQNDKLKDQLSVPLSEIVRRKEESEEEVMYHI